MDLVEKKLEKNEDEIFNEVEQEKDKLKRL